MIQIHTNTTTDVYLPHSLHLEPNHYHHSATAKYLSSASGLPPAAKIAHAGRATPDVAALGEGYQVSIDISIGSKCNNRPRSIHNIQLLTAVCDFLHLDPIIYLIYTYNHQVVTGRGVLSVGGTSASAPTFAAIIALLNDIRGQQGTPPLGFLNPWLYQNPDMFRDVVVGNNRIGRGGLVSGLQVQ